MTDETGLAAALARWNRPHLSNSAAIEAETRDWQGVADAALAFVAARLADPGTVEAVARALVRATEDDCDGYFPLTDVEVGTFAVTRREEAEVALAVVRGLLGGTGGEGGE